MGKLLDAASVWDGPPENWPADHCRVLYCISKYAEQARTVQHNHSWIRQVALLVLIYEGIELGVFQFDYAPNLVWLSYERQTERKWLRISQEAKSVIDDLWETKLVNGIKLSSVNYQPVTAYQASLRGLEIVASIPQQIKDEADRVLYPADNKTLVKVKYDGEEFHLIAGDMSKKSGVTEAEDVSYVSSPFIPSCLRSNSNYRVEPTSNKLRATESACGHSMMGKDAKESLILSQVRALVGEWLPFGANQIGALNERLGAMERCQGGLFSSKIDEHPTQTHFEVPPGLTQVKILDFDNINFINFEAEINFPESDGIIQVENFGMHLHVSGALLYGVKIDAIMHHTERSIPLDLLARLLVDVHQDSSEIIRDLLSQYQISVLDMLFMGRASQRNKYNLIMSTGIEPKLPACKYLDKGDRENELKQILGEIYACYDITRDDVLFLGRDGCLISGPSAHKYESLLTTFMGLNSREMFIRNFFVRTFVLDDTLTGLRKLIRNYRRVADSATVLKQGLSDAARNTILLIESLQFLLESVEDLELPPMPTDIASIKIYKSLTLLERKNNILVRCKDSIKLIEKLRTQLDTLIAKFDSISKLELIDVATDFDLNIERAMELATARQQSLISLEIMRVILAGNLAFEIVDRLSGGTFNVTSPQWFIDAVKTPFMDPPLVFFLLNLAWFLVVLFALVKWIQKQTVNVQASILVRADVGKKISLEKLHQMLRKRDLKSHDTDTGQQPNAELESYQWWEKGFPQDQATTLVELVVNEKQQVLRSVRLQTMCSLEDCKPLHIRRKHSLLSSRRRLLFRRPSEVTATENNVLEKFTSLLRNEGVYPERMAPLARLGTVKNLLAVTDGAQLNNSRALRRRSATALLQERRVS